jgi:hypothetical protein
MKNNTTSYRLLWLILLINSLGLGYLYIANKPNNTTDIPSLIGTWSGENTTLGAEKGYKTWENAKTITITEQKDRRFRGTFSYADGTKNFFGVIYPDNQSFTWVATNAKGFNHGRILDGDTIGACYVESWEDATVGCATLERE